MRTLKGSRTPLLKMRPKVKTNFERQTDNVFQMAKTSGLKSRKFLSKENTLNLFFQSIFPGNSEPQAPSEASLKRMRTYTK